MNLYWSSPIKVFKTSLTESQTSGGLLKMLSSPCRPPPGNPLCLWTSSVNLSTAVWCVSKAFPELTAAGVQRENCEMKIMSHLLSHPAGLKLLTVQVFTHRKLHSNSWKHGEQKLNRVSEDCLWQASVSCKLLTFCSSSSPSQSSWVHTVR